MDDTPATDRTADADLVDADEAAAVIGVDASRIEVMVDDGLLSVAARTDAGPLFRRAEVEAVRLAGA